MENDSTSARHGASAAVGGRSDERRSHMRQRRQKRRPAQVALKRSSPLPPFWRKKHRSCLHSFKVKARITYKLRASRRIA
jgi:hypothetical protein